VEAAGYFYFAPLLVWHCWPVAPVYNSFPDPPFIEVGWAAAEFIVRLDIIMQLIFCLTICTSSQRIPYSMVPLQSIPRASKLTQGASHRAHFDSAHHLQVITPSPPPFRADAIKPSSSIPWLPTSNTVLSMFQTVAPIQMLRSSLSCFGSSTQTTAHLWRKVYSATRQ